MTQQTTVASGYIPGAGKLQHKIGIVDGVTCEYSDIGYDAAGNEIAGLSFVVLADFTIEVVPTGSVDPGGRLLLIQQVRFQRGSHWTDYESYLVPVEAYDDRIEPDPTTTVVYYTTDDGTELVRPI